MGGTDSSNPVRAPNLQHVQGNSPDCAGFRFSCLLDGTRRDAPSAAVTLGQLYSPDPTTIVAGRCGNDEMISGRPSASTRSTRPSPSSLRVATRTLGIVANSRRASHQMV